MSDETTLLPCPFCGGEAHISDDYSSERGMVYSVWHNCPAGGDYHPYGQGVGMLQVTSAWFSSREEAITAWNTRATHGTLTAEQVREAIRKYAEDDSCYIFEVYGEMCGPIADELNTMLERGECSNADYDYPYLFECSECGWECCDTYSCDSEFNYCPNCRRKVKR